MNILRFCLDRRVLATLAVAALGIAVLAPGALAAALPLLLLAACPLSMIAMAVAMNRGAARDGSATSVEAKRAELTEPAARQRRLERELSVAAAEPEVAR